MGADVIVRTRYECANGCQIGGHCPGHDVAVWYREGMYYLAQDGQDYRSAVSMDAGLLDAVSAALQGREDAR